MPQIRLDTKGFSGLRLRVERPHHTARCQKPSAILDGSIAESLSQLMGNEALATAEPGILALDLINLSSMIPIHPLQGFAADPRQRASFVVCQALFE